jgi:TolB-like protein
MKTNFTLFALVVILLLADAAAQAAPPTVAVYDFTGDGDAAGYGRQLTTLVTADLTTETNLVMLERAELDKALSEQAFGMSGMVSSDAAAKIGQITGAKVLVAGQVIKTDDGHLVIVADIIGTETGRLFASQVEGGPENLLDLSAALSRKIAKTISDQATNLITPAQESSEDHQERIIKSISGTNRPSVSVDILYPVGKGRHSATAEAELGHILLSAGFAVVDGHSDRKPDIEITGMDDIGPGPRQGALYNYRCVVDLKIQERRTGEILGFDHQVSTATDTARAAADKSSQVNAIDALAERVLPLLAK